MASWPSSASSRPGLERCSSRTLSKPAPTPAENEVLVRVHASSVNPVDNGIAAGMLAGMGVEHQYPVTLGRDYAGLVEQAAAGISSYAPRDQVYGFVLHANPA